MYLHKTCEMMIDAAYLTRSLSLRRNEERKRVEWRNGGSPTASRSLLWPLRGWHPRKSQHKCNNGASTRQGRRGGQVFCTSLCISCRRPGEDGRKQSAWESGPPVQSSFHAGIPSAPIASGKCSAESLDTKDVRKTYFHLPHQRVEVEVQ